MRIPKATPSVTHVRLPFSMDGEVGLGDAVKRVASSVGIPTCGDCERRAAVLNRRVVFTGRGTPPRS